jgi:predicted ATP-dependent Lon-type protease
MSTFPSRDALDDKVNRTFAGKVVRKDLVRKVKVGANVPVYAALMTGPTTVANLFGHMGGKTKGLVQIWDVVGFDEVADLEKMPKEVITTLKTYCESGAFQRGQRLVSTGLRSHRF